MLEIDKDKSRVQVSFLMQLKAFTIVKVPRYFETHLQKIALTHLKLPDMGKLRDKLDGQLYYNTLKSDYFAEYAFEKNIGIRVFDWEKREAKNTKRKVYFFDDKKVTIIVINGEKNPKISVNHVTNCVFVYMNEDNKAYLSGIANTSYLNKLAEEQGSKIIEISDFEELTPFSGKEALLDIIE